MTKILPKLVQKKKYSQQINIGVKRINLLVKVKIYVNYLIFSIYMTITFCQSEAYS